MPTYIALLRGINVSGQKKIKMADLQKLLEAAGLQQVKTYIQSGNIIFSHASDAPEIEQMIEQQIEAHYGFAVKTIVRTPEELRQMLEHNPFADEDVKLQYFVLLAEVPADDVVEKLKTFDYQPEAYALKGKTVYFFVPNGYGKAKMNNNFFEQKLKVAATTRNWKTISKLLEISEAY